MDRPLPNYPRGEGLDAYCAWINSLGWVRTSGKPYRVIQVGDKPPELTR